MKQVLFAVLLVTASFFAKADGNAQDVAEGFINSQQNQHRVDTTYYVSEDLFLIRKITETTVSIIGDSVSHKTVTETSQWYGKVPAEFSHLSSAQVQSLIEGKIIAYRTTTANLIDRADFRPRAWWSLFTYLLKPTTKEIVVTELTCSHKELVTTNRTIYYDPEPWYLFGMVQLLCLGIPLGFLFLVNYKFWWAFLFYTVIIVGAAFVLWIGGGYFLESLVLLLPLSTIYLPVAYGLIKLILHTIKKLKQSSLPPATMVEDFEE